MNTSKNLFTVLGEWWDARQAESRTRALSPSHRRWSHFLPSPGNVIFTLVMIGLLVAAQSVGALPLGRPFAAPTAPSTGAIAYQGRLADSAGVPLTGTYNMIFRLYDAASGGTPLWEEQWTGSNGVQVSDGLFNVMLGSLTALPESVIAGHDQLFLGITVGTDDEMAPRVQLGSVPFAVQALTVPDGSISGTQLAPTGFGIGDKPLLNFVPVSPRITVLDLSAQSSSTDWVTLDLSPWLPVGAEAVLLYTGAADLNSATIPVEIRFDKPSVREGVFVNNPGAPNDHWQLEQGIVPVDDSRHIEYKVIASGNGTFRAGVLVVGYYERANRP